MSEPLAIRTPSEVSPTPSSSDDFARLEERVVQLVERHREAQKQIEELRQRLRASEDRVHALRSELAQRDALRDELRTRLDQVIEWVGALERSAERDEGEAARSGPREDRMPADLGARG